MIKKWISVILSAMVCMVCSNVVFAANPMVKVLMNSNDDGYTVECGEQSKTSDVPIILLFLNGDVVFDADVIIKNGTTMVPLRMIGDRLGVSTKWNAETKSIDMVKSDTNIKMTIGSNKMVVNGKEIQIQHAPEVSDGFTYVPLRAIATGFGADVGYVPHLTDHGNILKAVYVQDKKDAIQISEQEAIEKAKNLYFQEFLPTMQSYLLETRNVDVKEVNPTNIQSKLQKTYTGKCIADFGEYYEIELFDKGMEYVLVDKYTGQCYPVSGYSVVLFEIGEANGFSSWGLHYQ